MYRMETIFNVYRAEFRPIGHDNDWPSYDGIRIRPNPRLMRIKRGLLVSTRIRNNIDNVEHGGKKRCGLCRQVIHTQRTCTILDGGATTSSWH
ncbi:hypothetical protein AHAS_Ahas13G0132300 [Arachis hypogaea]